MPSLQRIGQPARWVVFGVVALGAAQSIVVAYPGLTGEGPPLSDYARMAPAARQRAVGADGSPAPYLDAIEKVRPGEVSLFDISAELPYYAWPFDLSRRARRIPDDVSPAQARRIVDDPSVRMLIVGDATTTGALIRTDPRFAYQFHCHTGTCAVYVRRSTGPGCRLPGGDQQSNSCIRV
ncbi:MAG: hypothetical protein JO280_03555 [Mycobacteriaceae bacterium]|nr:hypothetical protein [Mycobacteriaceae bacterium]